MPARLRQILPAVIGLVLFLAALEVLRIDLRTLSWTQLMDDVRLVPLHRLLLALALTIANYAALTGYDFLAFASIETRLAPVRIAAASLLSYAISNNVGFGMLSGASMRYRFYTRWGVGGEELSRIVVSYTITFWLGLFALGGLSLVLSPPRDLFGPSAEALSVAIGWLLLAAVLAYLAATALPRGSRSRRTDHSAGPATVDWRSAVGRFISRVGSGRRRALCSPAGRDSSIRRVSCRVLRRDPHWHG